MLRWFDTLDDAGQARLLAQIESLDLDWLARVVATHDEATTPAVIEPYRDVIRAGDPGDPEALARGEVALRSGQVGCLLVAGGQGTRLGFDGPKGGYPIGAVSGRTLFALHVEQLLALGGRYGHVPLLMVMTSPANHQATRVLFARHDNYGLPADRLMIFPQGVCPAVDEQGKLLLGARDSLVMSPNGNGGLFAALAHSGALDRMKAEGVESISYIQVDNALSRPCDPLFVGHHLRTAAQYSCKAIPKLDAHEKVGNFSLVDGRLGIVEYTEIPDALAEARDARSGELLFGHGNPGLFVWSRDFAQAQADRTDLPYHKAHKKIRHLDERGELVEPDGPCGYKLESFALDTLLDAERAAIVACERDAEFAPVKNATGTDSPESARALMTALYRGWIEAAGGTVTGDGQVEISARYAYDADELKERIPAGFEADGDLFLR